MYNKKSHIRKEGRLYEVIQCLKEGMDRNQIAEELGVTKRTVDRYIQEIRKRQGK